MNSSRWRGHQPRTCLDVCDALPLHYVLVLCALHQRPFTAGGIDFHPHYSPDGALANVVIAHAHRQQVHIVTVGCGVTRRRFWRCPFCDLSTPGAVQSVYAHARQKRQLMPSCATANQSCALTGQGGRVPEATTKRGIFRRHVAST